jgi:DNA-binding transcriptional LysR family regulator
MTFGSVTKAAMELNTSQPMVSKLLSQLEQDVGFKLFDRRRNHLVATPEAEAFHSTVPRFLTAFSEIHNEAKAISNKQIGRIVIAAQPIYINTFLLDIVAKFKKLHPHVGVKIIDVGLETLLKAVTDHSCDIGIGITLDAGAYRASRIALGRCEARCIMHKDHPLAQKSVIELDDFNGTSTVELSLGSPLRTRVDYMMQSKGIQRHIAAEARTLYAVVGLVQRGVGIAVVDPFAVLLNNQQAIVDIPLAFPVSWDMAVYFRSNKPTSAIEQAFVEIVRQESNSLKKRGVIQ